jgi:iron complex outermembrane recepter protein
MLKPNLLALAVASVLVSGAVYAADADSNATGYPQKSAPAQPDGTGGADQTTTPGSDQTEAKPTDDSTVNLGEIKVTGVRAAIQEAISVKQNSNEIVEAISAEDIGKLPDNSIAESLARLPGITAQRINGSATLVSIRGFSGDFNGTLLNGREQVSTGDNRAVEFDQYPSEIMAGVVVYKTPDASLVGQGISGTVDMQTVRPLDFSQRTISLSARGETNSNGSVNPNTDAQGYRIAAAYIDQYNDHTLGLSIAYARQKSPVQDNRWEPYGYTTTSATGDAYVLGGGKVYADSIEGTRDSVMTTLEWRPNDQYASVLDLYYSKFNQDTTYRGFEACLAYCVGAPIDPTYTGNVMTSGTFENVKPVLRDELDAHNDKIYEIGWNNKFHFADHWTATADLSYGKATSSQSFLEEYAGTVPGTPGATDTFGVTLNPVTGVPTFSPGLNYLDTNIIKLVDSGGWGQDGYLKFPKVTDEMKVARVDLSRDINSFVSKMDFGFNYNDRTKTRVSNEWLLDLPGGTSTNADIPANCIVPSVNLGYVGFPSTVSWDLNCVLPLYDQIPKYHQDILNKDWTVEEKISTAYLKFDIDTDVGGLPLRGNIGGQYIHSEQNSTAFAVGAGDAVNGVSNVSAGTSYNDFLPDMNLAMTLPYEQIVRFSAGRQIARPRLDDMRASTEYNLSSGINTNGLTTTCTNTQQPELGSAPCYWSGSGGNPNLKPFLANAYDLAWEKYWENKAYVSAAFWYKDLQTYIYNQNLPKDFAGLPDPTGGVLQPASTLGVYTQPANGQGGYMRGYELTASLPLEVLFASAEGFGFNASYSDTESSIQPNGPGSTPQPFPGLSKYVLNATFYYEKNGFSARIAERHRSDFLGEVQGFGADQSFVDIKGETITDLQLSYTFTESEFKGLTVLFQVNNLTNEPYRQTVTVGNGQVLPQQYTDYGRQILLGATYKF